jgi:hypothetical protein
MMVASELGAAGVVDTRRESVAELVSELTDGSGARTRGMPAGMRLVNAGCPRRVAAGDGRAS